MLNFKLRIRMEVKVTLVQDGQSVSETADLRAWSEKKKISSEQQFSR